MFIKGINAARYYFPSVYLSDLSIKDGPLSVCVASVSIGTSQPGMF